MSQYSNKSSNKIFDIRIRRGEEVFFHFIHRDFHGNPIDLSSANASLQISKSFLSPRYFLESNTEVTRATRIDQADGLSGGDTGATFGAGIVLNAFPDGSTGNTGGVLVRLPADSTKNLPLGLNFYDIVIENSVEGRKVARWGEFYIDASKTRN
jgi:hypothetical protein